jgi:hypothetical protein
MDRAGFAAATRCPPLALAKVSAQQPAVNEASMQFESKGRHGEHPLSTEQWQ